MKRIAFLSFLLILGFVNSQSQQITTPAPSPPQVIKQDFGLSSMELSYSRPAVKGRIIFGDLVPYGKIWRTGANAATTLSFGDEVTIGGQKIPAGKYGLLTIPGAAEWIIILSKQTDVNNPNLYKQDQDLVRVTVKPQALSTPVESLTLQFENMTPTQCELALYWDRVSVRFSIQTEIDSKIMGNIHKAMDQDNRPYYQAAMYYMENGKDLNQALEWFNKATDQNPDAFFMFYQKARCQAKLGHKGDALATARKSLELSQKAGNPDYVTLNEKLIASLK